MICEAQEFADLQSSGNLHLRSYFIAGNTVLVTANETGAGGTGGGGVGDVMLNQMYGQYMLPQKEKSKKHYPIVFVHGGILSSKSWQTTPDGRMGWDEYFVRQGFDAYLADQVSRARSGFDGRKFNLVRAGVLPPTEQPPVAMATDQVLPLHPA